MKRKDELGKAINKTEADIARLALKAHEASVIAFETGDPEDHKLAAYRHKKADKFYAKKSNQPAALLHRRFYKVHSGFCGGFGELD